MSALRYVVLAVPAAFLGLRFAPALNVSEVVGLICGLVGATVISSIVFLAWTRKALFRESHRAQNPAATA
jgi:Na+-driven multidrug efflux pump